MSTISIADAGRRELGASFSGALIGPQDDGYDAARAVFNAMIDRRPALIARCADPDDVAATIRFARERDLLLAVRGGGHSGGGFGICDDGVVLDLSLLRSIDVDPAARTVRVGGGCTWGEVDRATHEHGLATPSGVIATTGVGGLTLGGGLGHLTRKHGLTIDNLLEAEVVLADGSRARASADENADLFWALRGGGGNFGVVTSFTFRCHPVSTVLAGPTFWPIEQTAEVLHTYREFIGSAPRELSGFFAVMTVPPAPMFPEELHLRKVCAVVWCYTGSEDTVDGLVAPLLAVGTRCCTPSGRCRSPRSRACSTGSTTPACSGTGGATSSTSWTTPRSSSTRPSGRRCRRCSRRCTSTRSTGRPTTCPPPTRPSATATRASPRSSSASTRIPRTRPTIRQWTVDYFDATHPYSAGGSYVNFMMDEGAGRVRATYRHNYERLARTKAAYDPRNVFRVNQNIEPRAA